MRGIINAENKLKSKTKESYLNFYFQNRNRHGENVLFNFENTHSKDRCNPI